MDRQQIIAALTALGRRLHAEGLQGEMYVVGGAAIALTYAPRRVTRDIDAVFEPKMAIYRIAAAVAEVLAVAEDVFGDRLDAAARFFVEEILAAGTGR
ncbi:MAG: hypothetical protein DLM65_11250 [Candidatus Aeolococcus gillhamiae]|uniref:DUF6036 domain-containing protein n=1 Tax=Candidatus Aeolococcus gillhamiae TaxID=3127015 RepID=A0A2W6ANC2_9BACT|nr:MAG: hypothetical protein DLM65_11250 [Candidatus Dormibacter sp. RRmetagenome_bin12]